nr:amidase family protein [Micromonospora sp. DSM 115978]
MTRHRPAPPAEELCWWPAWRVAEAIRAGTVSARDHLEAQLARIDRFNPRLNLVVTIDERARSWADAADAAAACGQFRGPLHGVAVTVKDSLATAGLRTTAGSPDLASYVPDADAAAVAALRDAGAVVFGKTNLAEGSADVQSHNPVFGTARNPWDPRYTTGGSSGGSAGAVAAGFVPLDLGSDVAGSIRLPAAQCGVVAHKPSFGVVPMAGHLPPYQPVTPDLAVVGPIGRSVRDLETVLDVITAPHRWDRTAWTVRLPPARPVRRVATWFDDPHCPVDEEVRAALEFAAARLARTGTPVVAATPPGVRLDAADLVARRMLASVAVGHHSAGRIERIAAGLEPAGAGLGAEFVAQRYDEWLRADALRNRLRARWERFFQEYDAILLPVAPHTVQLHDHRPFDLRRVLVDGAPRPYLDQIVWACLTGVCHLPTTVVPVRLDARGLPIGIAVVGPYLADRTALAVAGALVAALPAIGRPDLPAGRSSGQDRPAA